MQQRIEDRKKSLVYRSYGVPLQVLNLEASELGCLAHDVRVRMTAAPVNPSDLIPITGAYSHRVRPPRVAGYEGVGTVVEARSRFAHLEGKRVLPLRCDGTWQTHIDCDATWLVVVPDRVADDVAASAYINPMTASLMMRRWPVRGKQVMLTAASSACGLLLAQWAVQLGAARVTATSRFGQHDQRLRRYGAEPLDQEDLEGVMDRASKADLVFDAVGGALANAIWSVLASDACMVSYGLLAGIPASSPIAARRAEYFRLFDYVERLSPEDWQEGWRRHWDLLAEVELGPAENLPLDQWRQALVQFGQAGRSAKPVLTMTAATGASDAA